MTATLFESIFLGWFFGMLAASGAVLISLPVSLLFSVPEAEFCASPELLLALSVAPTLADSLCALVSPDFLLFLVGGCAVL